MPRPSVIPEIKERLESWLEAREAEYQTQPNTSRKTTLPHTPDFKINVTGVAEAIGLTGGQRKYLHEREELASLLNTFAEEQGLLPVGSRLLTDTADKVIQQKMVMQASRAKEDAQAAVEANARVESLMEELSLAHARIAELECELMRFKAREEMLQAGIMVRVAE